MDVHPVRVGVQRSGVAPAGEQQCVGRFLGHPLDGIAEGELKAVVGREPLEGVGRSHALADAPADAGGVVKDEPQRHTAAELEHRLEALTHAFGRLSPEALGQRHVREGDVTTR